MLLSVGEIPQAQSVGTQALQDNPDTQVKVEGYTDDVGSAVYNRTLLQRRAQAVADALRSRGVSPDQFEVQGLGEKFPVASNDTASGRQQNRRVEIVFSDQSGRFARHASRQSQLH